jgi:peptidoglycan/LPS O-acetylase OafA/YrhL
VSQARPELNAASAYFPWLDPLRGFAALSVLAAHLVMLAQLPIPTWYPLGWFRIGFLGVDLFFAISGAVILGSVASLQKRNSQGFHRAFALRRLARIVPLYVLTCAVFVVLVRPEILARPDAPQVILAHLFFVQNLFPSTHGVINGPSWTLGVEMQFYLVMLLFGPWLLRLSMTRLALLGLAIGLGWRALVWWTQVAGQTNPDTNLVFIWQTQLPGVIDEFVAGMLALRWWQTRATRAALPGPATAAGLSVAALVAWSLVIGSMHALMASYWTSPLSVIVLRSGIAVAVGLSVAAALSWPALRRPLPGLRLSGDLSYGIYLWHMGALLLWQAAIPEANPWVFGAAVLGSTLLLATAGWFALERPVMRAARRLERVRPAQLAAE